MRRRANPGGSQIYLPAGPGYQAAPGKGAATRMEVSREELERLARFVDKARHDALEIRSLVRVGELVAAEETALALHVEGAHVKTRMRDQLGITADESPARPPDVPLEMLDSPANRRLARLLREAYEAAVEVDKERGTWPDGRADGVADLAAAVELEVYGPAGKD